MASISTSQSSTSTLPYIVSYYTPNQDNTATLVLTKSSPKTKSLLPVIIDKTMTSLGVGSSPMITPTLTQKKLLEAKRSKPQAKVLLLICFTTLAVERSKLDFTGFDHVIMVSYHWKYIGDLDRSNMPVYYWDHIPLKPSLTSVMIRNHDDAADVLGTNQEQFEKMQSLVLFNCNHVSSCVMLDGFAIDIEQLSGLINQSTTVTYNPRCYSQSDSDDASHDYSDDDTNQNNDDADNTTTITTFTIPDHIVTSIVAYWDTAASRQPTSSFVYSTCYVYWDHIIRAIYRQLKSKYNQIETNIEAFGHINFKSLPITSTLPNDFHASDAMMRRAYVNDPQLIRLQEISYIHRSMTSITHPTSAWEPFVINDVTNPITIKCQICNATGPLCVDASTQNDSIETLEDYYIGKPATINNKSICVTCATYGLRHHPYLEQLGSFKYAESTDALTRHIFNDFNLHVQSLELGNDQAIHYIDSLLANTPVKDVLIVLDLNPDVMQWTTRDVITLVYIDKHYNDPTVTAHVFKLKLNILMANPSLINNLITLRYRWLNMSEINQRDCKVFEFTETEWNGIVFNLITRNNATVDEVNGITSHPVLDDALFDKTQLQIKIDAHYRTLLPLFPDHYILELPLLYCPYCNTTFITEAEFNDLRVNTQVTTHDPVIQSIFQRQRDHAKDHYMLSGDSYCDVINKRQDAAVPQALIQDANNKLKLGLHFHMTISDGATSVMYQVMCAKDYRGICNYVKVIKLE